MKNFQKTIFSKNYFEISAWKKSNYVCGIDEVGRGCLAGPLVTCAAILSQNTTHNLLKDSKILTEKERNIAYKWLIKNCFYSIAISSHKKIDSLNIYQTTIQTMKKALLQLLEITPFLYNQIKYILIDAMPLSLKEYNIYKNIEIHSFNKGESLSISIAAASIIAKVERDKLMKNVNSIFPKLNLEKHKGYGTAEHLDILTTYGPSIIHRSTFISKILKKEENNESKQQVIF